MTILAPHTVLVTFADLCRLAESRPDLDFTNGHSVSFQFSTAGDLLDVSWYCAAGLDVPEPRGVDSVVVAIIAMQAQNFLVSFLAGLELESARPQLSLF